MKHASFSCLTPAELVAYLDDTLSHSEERRVEAHLLDCPLCDAAMQGFAAHPNKQAALAEIEARSLPQTRHTQALKSEKTKRYNLNWLYFAAAAVVICLPFGYHWYQTNTAIPALAAEYSTLMPAPQAVVRGENSAAKTEQEQAFATYEQADYNASFDAFKKIVAAEPQNTEAAFYAGLSAMGKKDLENAQIYLEKVHLAPENENSDDALWYLAMLQLQQNKPERALDFLNELAASSNSWQQKAKVLIAELTK